MEFAGQEPGPSEKAEDIRLVVDTIPELVWSTRPDGSAEFFNQRWLEYTGLSAEQARDWGWKVALHPDDMPRMLETFHQALGLGRSFEIEGRFRRRDGEFRWFLFRGSTFLDGSGKTGSVVRKEYRSRRTKTCGRCPPRVSEEEFPSDCRWWAPTSFSAVGPGSSYSHSVANSNRRFGSRNSADLAQQP